MFRKRSCSQGGGADGGPRMLARNGRQGGAAAGPCASWIRLRIVFQRKFLWLAFQVADLKADSYCSLAIDDIKSAQQQHKPASRPIDNVIQ